MAVITPGACAMRPGAAERQGRGEIHPDVRPGGEGRLVQLGLPPALVLGERQRPGRHRQDHQQDRAALPLRPPAHLPAGQRRRRGACRGRSPGPAAGPAAGRSRSGIRAIPARATAGAAASTGLTPRLPPDSLGTAEYLRSSQSASAPRPISATSRPARAALASAACLPRRARAAPGMAGRSAGQVMMMMASTVMTAASHQVPPLAPRRKIPAAPPMVPVLAARWPTAAPSRHRCRAQPQPPRPPRPAAWPRRATHRQVAAGNAAGTEQRGFFLTLAGQQPCGEGDGGECQQYQFQRADEQQGSGHHQAAGQRGQGLRQAGGHLQPAQVAACLPGGDGRGQPLLQRGDAGRRDAGGVDADEPRRAADHQAPRSQRGRVHQHRAVRDERAQHELARCPQQAEPPVRRARVARAEQPGYPEPGRGTGRAVPQGQHVPDREVEHPAVVTGSATPIGWPGPTAPASSPRPVRCAR